MEFLKTNWFWIALVVFFIWMNVSGRGCCGRGRHGRDKREEGQGHQH